MSWWKKESKTVFVRNAEGKVVAIEHLGDQPRESKTSVSSALMKQYYEKHPEKTKSAKLQRFGTKMYSGAISTGKRLDDYSLKYAKSQRRTKAKPMPPLGSYSFSDNFNPIGDKLDRGIKKPQSRVKYTIIGGKAYPIAGMGKKKKKKTQGKRRKYDSNDPFSFPDMF